MRPENYEHVCDLLKKRSGLVLSNDKVYLVENRLMPLARKRKMQSLDELLDAVREGGDEALLDEVTDAMTTNESFFFRDLKPFEQFREIILPRLVEARTHKKSLKIWCAAASTGQEPYSLAMILREAGAMLDGWNLEILATDISRSALERARAGVYTQFEVQRGLPVQALVKYFQQEDTKWQIDESLRSMVRFREFNLLDSLSSIGPCDVIFCRNVLIYFDQDDKAQILERMTELLPSDGYVYLGGAETVIGVTDKLAPVPNLHGAYAIVKTAAGAGATAGTPSATGSSAQIAV